MNRKFSVLIAEDEYEIGRALKEMVAGHPDFEVTGVVSDGAEAVRFINAQKKPDLLITDIRMPVMDGLELLKYIRGRGIDMYCVIVSGYNNFEYARVALVNGAANYLLKPVRREDCMNMLDAAAKTLKDSTGKSFDLDSALARRGHSLPDQDGVVKLCAACYGNFPFTSSPSQDETICERLSDTIKGVGCDVIGCACKNGVYFALYRLPDGKEPFDTLKAVADDAYTVESSCVVMLSREIAAGEDLCALSSRMLSQMRSRAVFAGYVAIDMANMKNANDSNAFGKLFTMDDAMIDSIRFRDYSQFSDALKCKFVQWRKEGLPVNALMDYVRFQYIYAGQRLFSSKGANGAPMPYDWESSIASAFTVSKSWDELFNAVFGEFKKLLDACQIDAAPKSISSEIEVYINTRYAEHITNQSLAKHFGFVPSYISKLFKDYKGVSPCDYLTQVRIENAQRIIRETGNVNLSEISALTGFSDPSYFSKIFKKVVGISPSDYRNHIAQVRK